MKIIYVLTDLAMGGAEVQVIRMSQYMKEQNHQVILVSMMKAEADDMMQELKRIGVKYYSLDMNRGRVSINAFIDFIKIVRTENPDVIHSHMIHANLLLRSASPFIGCRRKINTIHGEEEYLGIRKIIYRLTDFAVDYTVCCGKILYEQAKRHNIVSSTKLKYICNGLNTNSYVYDETSRKRIRNSIQLNESFVWITVGRLSEVKNQSYLIEEFREVLIEYPQTKLLIVGDGPLMGRLKQLTKVNNISNNVIFTGKRSDITELLSSADAFVLSSLHEGLPLSLQEAGAVGLPLVSTDVGGCNEVICEGLNGYLCESNKRLELAKKMMMIMEKTKDERIEMGERSREIVIEKFDIYSVMRE